MTCWKFGPDHKASPDVRMVAFLQNLAEQTLSIALSKHSGTGATLSCQPFRHALKLYWLANGERRGAQSVENSAGGIKLQSVPISILASAAFLMHGGLIHTDCAYSFTADPPCVCSCFMYLHMETIKNCFFPESNCRVFTEKVCGARKKYAWIILDNRLLSGTYCKIKQEKLPII